MSTTGTILFSFLQLPQEGSSGAPRSIRSVAELLAASGWKVRALATSATEGALAVDAEAWLRSAGHAVARNGKLLYLTSNDVRYDIVDTGRSAVRDLKFRSGDDFDTRFNEILREDRPDILVTYGGWGAEWDRRARARQAGCRVIFSPRNESYTTRRAFQSTDASFCSSNHLARLSRDQAGVDTAYLPLPVLASEAVAPKREPHFLTFVNPEPRKGVTVFARIAEEVSRAHPEIPILVMSSRQGGQLLVDVGLRGGFDLRRHPNIVIGEAVPQPSTYLAVTRVLLVPSIHEPAARVAAEALLNSIPPVVSDREGLPGVVGGGGFILPLPEGLSVRDPVPPPAEDVKCWVDLSIRLMKDPWFYAQASQRALEASAVYRTDALRRTYHEFFSSLLR